MSIKTLPAGVELNVERRGTDAVLITAFKPRWYGDKIVDQQLLIGLGGRDDDELAAAVQGGINALIERVWADLASAQRIDDLITRSPLKRK